jgi:hypothetical protein
MTCSGIGPEAADSAYSVAHKGSGTSAMLRKRIDHKSGWAGPRA